MCIRDRYGHVHAYALYALGYSLSTHIPGEADALLRQAETEARTLGDPALAGMVLAGLAAHASRTGDQSSARTLLEEALSLVENRAHRVHTLTSLAVVEFGDGALERAHELVQEARGLAEQNELSRELRFIDLTSAYIELVRGNTEEADRYLASLRQALDESGARRLLAPLILGNAALCVQRGEIEKAIETWSRAESVTQEQGVEWDYEERLLIEQLLEPLRSLRSEEEFQRCWEAGQAASTDDRT
jgi:tetratricopeptide (TPR) repeat protein